ncbi:MAG: hypothetical protein CMJ81_17810 [Planctomycetaceae bacterium]|nr:hypothetical protein [Planctomycetaceae bacterium]
MSGSPFRFLQASDLHLEQPLYGVEEIPDHLRELFIEAPLRAAKRLFDLAVDQEVEFVLLVGDVLHPFQAGPAACTFLVEQFQRLAEREISVYWSAGSVEHFENWPVALELPRQVHFCDQTRTEPLVHQREGVPLASVVAGDLSNLRGHEHGQDGADLYRIALSCEAPSEEMILHGGFSYWALGGRHQRCTVSDRPGNSTIAHDAGSPQGRCPGEEGSHGVTLIHVEDDGSTTLEPMATDVATWVQERVEIDDSTAEEDLEELLNVRASELANEGVGRTQLVTWTIVGGDSVGWQMRRGVLAGNLLERLRKNFGYEETSVWSLTLNWESGCDLPASWYEEETLRGEFLRHARDLSGSDHSLQSFVPELEEGNLESLGVKAAVDVADDGEETERLFREVSLLASDLLSGGRSG